MQTKPEWTGPCEPQIRKSADKPQKMRFLRVGGSHAFAGIKPVSG